jgi:hypothetical protein
VLRGALIAVALLASIPVGAAAVAISADAITALDEYDVRSAIILNCHPRQTAVDRTLLARGDALRRAALQELWAQLDEGDRAHHAENGKRAEETLRQRHDARNFDIQEQVRNYGCDWLDSSKREELGFEQGRTAAPAPTR